MEERDTNSKKRRKRGRKSGQSKAKGGENIMLNYLNKVQQENQVV